MAAVRLALLPGTSHRAGAIIAASMNSKNLTRTLTLLAIIAAPSLTATSFAQATELPKYPQLPSETPAQFQPATGSFDHVRREVMIPMRDGVKLHTVILVPKTATMTSRAPILLTRTPYNADDLTSHVQSAHLGP